MGGCGGDKMTLVPLCGSNPATGRVGCHYLYDEDIDAFTERTDLTRDDVRAVAVELWTQHGEESNDGSRRHRLRTRSECGP